MKIIIDCMGGDNAPQAPVMGAIQAHREYGVDINLVGRGEDILKVLVTEEELQKRVGELGEALYEKFEGKNPLFLGVLKGSFIFMADLIRATQLKSDLEFMSVSSYANATESSGRVHVNYDLQQDITGRHLIIVEDILDSGNTLYYLMDVLRARKPASIKICTLLDKPDRRTKPITANYTGFTIPDAFVVGYGLDYAQKYRNLPYIGVVELDEE